MTIHSSTPAWKISRIEEPDSSNPWVQTESDMIEKMSTFMYTWDYLLETFNNMTSISCSLRKVSSFLFSHSVVSDSLWPMDCSVPGFPTITNTWSLLKLMSMEVVMPSNYLILCCPLLLLPLIFSSIRVFSNESVLHIRWPKYWSFSLIISPSNEYAGLISFRMGWLDLLAVQGTLKSLLHHHSSKASILLHSAFFIVRLSHPYMTTGKTTALTRQTFIDKVTSLLFNVLSRLVIAFLPRSKCLNFMAANHHLQWFWRAPPQKKNKVSHCVHCFPIHLFVMKWWDWMPWS